MKLFRWALLPIWLLLGTPAFGQDFPSMRKLLALAYEGKIKEALPFLDKIIDSAKIKAARNPKEKHSYLSWLQNKAALYEMIGEFSKAEQIYNQKFLAEKGLKDPTDIDGLKQTLNRLAQLYEKMGNTESAELVLEQLIVMEYGNTVTKATDKKEMFINYYKTVLAQYIPKKGDADTAEIRREAEEAWERQQESQGDSSSEAKQAQAMVEMMAKMMVRVPPPAKLPTAAQLSQIRQGKLKLGGHRSGANINDPWNEMQRLFTIYTRAKNFAAAESLIKQAIAIDDYPGNTDNTISDFMKMTMGGPGFAEAMEKATGMGKAFTFTQQVMNTGDKHGGVDVFYIQNKVLLAQLYQEQGKKTQYNLLADTISKLCEKMASETNPGIMASVADSYSKISRNKNAELLYKNIISYFDNQTHGVVVLSPQYLTALRQLATLYKADHNGKEAIAVLEKSMAYDRKVSGEKYPDHISRAIDLTQLYEDTNQPALAEATCSNFLSSAMDMVKDNLGLLSEREKIAFINDQVSAFDLSASLLITNPHAKDSFIQQTYNQQLRLKGLALNDQQKVLESMRKNGNPQLKKLIDKWQITHTAIAWQYSQPKNRMSSRVIDSLTAVANTQEKQINELSTTFSRKNRPGDVKQVKSRLQNGEAAIEFVRFRYYHKGWTDSVMYAAYIILPNDPAIHFVPLCAEKQLATLLKVKNGESTSAYIKGLYAGDDAQRVGDLPKNVALYNLVWKPVAPFLKGANKIAVAPAGLLNRVAFNALSAGNGAYLIDKFELRQYHNIAEVAAEDKDKNATNKSITLYGGINFDVADSVTARTNSSALSAFSRSVEGDTRGNAFAALPGTLNEVEAIGALFKANHINASTIIGSKATESSLKRLSGNSPWLLHLATHGFALPDAEENRSGAPAAEADQFASADNPMFRSGIMMAGANKVWTGGLPVRGREDGIVTAYEISNLDLSNTSLVVLSACQTALGDIKGTEGVFGLQRALKLAGVQAMIVSLWQVPDEETAQLMKIFYSNKIAGKTNYEALKTAQESLRKEHSPYFWAAFELIE